VPIASFCVEAGRWQRRGAEESGRFAASPAQVSGKELKLAVNYARKQDQVWAKVRDAQMKLGKNVGQSVANKQSPTSLQLTLEDKKLLESLDQYIKELAKVPEGKRGVVGYAVAINGQVEGADVYASTALFEKLWPKLIKSCAVDALAEWQNDKKFKPASEADVKAFLSEAAQGKKTDKDVSQRIQVITRESKKNLVLETCDRGEKNAVIHRSYLAK
jgi:hypothetical protein